MNLCLIFAYYSERALFMDFSPPGLGVIWKAFGGIGGGARPVWIFVLLGIGALWEDLRSYLSVFHFSQKFSDFGPDAIRDGIPRYWRASI